MGDVFSTEEVGLRDYFLTNKARLPSEKRRLFFVIQAGRLQCQNGAYLSEVDHSLDQLLLGPTRPADPPPEDEVGKEVRTGEHIAELRSRLGQSAFSLAVRQNYDFKCCFPDCSVANGEFLIGAHIARWADAPALRGSLENGLCLCLMHDKAFEMGMFTISNTSMVWVNRHYDEVAPNAWFKSHVLPHHGHTIQEGRVLPSEESLRQHWERTGLA